MSATAPGTTGSGSRIPQGTFAVPYGRQSLRAGETARPRKSMKHITAADVDAGAHSHLLAPRAHAKPTELTGITIECSGSRPVLIEHTQAGHHPKHVITGEPIYIDIKLPDGREVSVEVRLVDPLPLMMPDGGQAGPDEYMAASLSELIEYGEGEPDGGLPFLQEPPE